MRQTDQAPDTPHPIVLVGDTGATHSRLATCTHAAGHFELPRRETYRSSAHIPELSTDEVVCVPEGLADPAGNRVGVSVGTGPGVSASTPAGHTVATAAGQATFSPRRAPDLDLWEKIRREHGHVSWGRTASGRGLPRLHALPARLQAARFDARDIALSLMATGGLYLGGGVGTRVVGRRCSETSLEAVRDTGCMRPLLDKIPVYVVKSNDLALRKAAQKASAMFGS